MARRTAWPSMSVTAQEEGDNDAKSLRAIRFKADALPSIPVFYRAIPRRYPVLSRPRFIAFSSLTLQWILDNICTKVLGGS